jgi:hypothetical protein
MRILGIHPIIVTLAALTVLCAYMGWLPTIDEETRALLRPPTIAAPAAAPSLAPARSSAREIEHDEAMLLVFFCVFVAPFAVMVALLVMMFAVDVASSVVQPVTRALQLPDAIARGSAVCGWATVVYLARPWWLTSCAWMVEVMTRAYQVALT